MQSKERWGGGGGCIELDVTKQLSTCVECIAKRITLESGSFAKCRVSFPLLFEIRETLRLHSVSGANVSVRTDLESVVLYIDSNSIVKRSINY